MGKFKEFCKKAWEWIKKAAKAVAYVAKNIASWVGLDGMHHIVYSTAITLALANLHVPIEWAVGVALLIGVLKEVVWDKLLKKGTFDPKDIICDLWGVVLGAIIFVL